VRPAIATLAPLAVSLAVFDGRTRPLFVAGLFLVVELFSNLVLETVLYAGSAGVLARIAASQPRAVVIGSVPPGGLSEARLLHKRLAAASSGSLVMLARWGADDASVADAGMATSIERSVGRTLVEARAQIRRVAQVAVNRAGGCGRLTREGTAPLGRALNDDGYSSVASRTLSFASP
jgi:hypothetical protein